MIGVDYTVLLNRDFRFFDNCVEGFISKREIYMNDMQVIGQRIAGKIAQAVWGASQFEKPLDTVRIRPETREEKILKTLREKGLV